MQILPLSQTGVGWELTRCNGIWLQTKNLNFGFFAAHFARYGPCLWYARCSNTYISAVAVLKRSGFNKTK